MDNLRHRTTMEVPSLLKYKFNKPKWPISLKSDATSKNCQQQIDLFYTKNSLNN